MAGTDEPDAEDEDGGEAEEAGSAVADEEGDEENDEEDDNDDEGEEDDDEDGDEDEEEGDDDEEEEDDDEEGDGDEDEGEDEDAEEDDATAQAGPSRYRYPPAVGDFQLLPEREKDFKLARYFKCREDGCECPGLFPPDGAEVVLGGSADDTDMQVDSEDAPEDRTEEGWWTTCGHCGHGWGGEAGHGLPEGLEDKERTRRCRVVGRIEELLQDDNVLTIFPTPHPPKIQSLLRQLEPFKRPTGGKKPVAPLPPALDLSRDSNSASPYPEGTPASDVEDAPAEDEAEESARRPKRSRTGETGSPSDALSPKHGKRPSKASGKGTKPRTVVRGSRGLVPMETDADGNQHPAGHLPDSAQGNEEAIPEEEDDEEDVPLAQRPQLDENERRRREAAKEREKEREAEVVRRLTKGVNVEEGELDGPTAPGVDVEVWEGVELPKLPLRPAAIEEANREIMLIVVGSRNPTSVATILLIGLKNLFQRQLPKMPREYITRLVLDKNHISMAIVKRGWKVVGGICYRPFESRGFAEIVFCAVDSSEQIKGYGSHLMNSLKDHVRKAHPTINHFLTYADNYAVGYFKKQGFTKEITLPRERWVGYIKDYEGGTIMQCTMLPKVKYMEVHQMLADQKAAILAKIRTISRSHIVHPGLTIFKNRKSGKPLTKDDVPGLAESGWNPDLDAIIRQPMRNPHHVYLQHVLNDLQQEPSAWPFVKPVDANVVHDYYEVILNPMDLSTMENKLENNHYASIDDFVADARLIFANCRQYNGEKSTYTQQANKLEKALDRIMKKRQL